MLKHFTSHYSHFVYLDPEGGPEHPIEAPDTTPDTPDEPVASPSDAGKGAEALGGKMVDKGMQGVDPLSNGNDKYVEAQERAQEAYTQSQVVDGKITRLINSVYEQKGEAGFKRVENQLMQLCEKNPLLRNIAEQHKALQEEGRADPVKLGENMLRFLYSSIGNRAGNEKINYANPNRGTELRNWMQEGRNPDQINERAKMVERTFSGL